MLLQMEAVEAHENEQLSMIRRKKPTVLKPPQYTAPMIKLEAMGAISIYKRLY